MESCGFWTETRGTERCLVVINLTKGICRRMGNDIMLVYSTCVVVREYGKLFRDIYITHLALCYVGSAEKPTSKYCVAHFGST